MNCLDCIGKAEDGNLSALKENQKTCTVFLSNQCQNFSMRGTFNETVQDTLIEVNPKKWSAARKVFAPALILFFALGIFLPTLNYNTVVGEEYMEQLGIYSGVTSKTTIDLLREGDFSPSQLFLYASRNRHYSEYQDEIEELLYSYLNDAEEKIPSQAYKDEVQGVIILTGVVTNIQTSTIAETRVWISDSQNRKTHSVIWYLNGDQISYSYIGRKVNLLTVLEDAGTGGHLEAKEWLLIPEVR
jgi:hypothetical protein